MRLFVKSFKIFIILFFVQSGCCSENNSALLVECLNLSELSGLLSPCNRYALSRTSKTLHDFYSMSINLERFIREQNLLEKNIFFQGMEESGEIIEKYLGDERVITKENFLKAIEKFICCGCSLRELWGNKTSEGHKYYSYIYRKEQFNVGVCPVLGVAAKKHNLLLKILKNQLEDEDNKSRRKIPTCFNVDAPPKRVQSYRYIDGKYYKKRCEIAERKNARNFSYEKCYCDKKFKALQHVIQPVILPLLIRLTTTGFLSNPENRKVYFNLTDFLNLQNNNSFNERDIHLLLKRAENVFPDLLRKESIQDIKVFFERNMDNKWIIEVSEVLTDPLDLPERTLLYCTIDNSSIADFSCLAVFFPEVFKRFEEQISSIEPKDFSFIDPYSGPFSRFFPFYHHFSYLSAAERKKMEELVDRYATVNNPYGFSFYYERIKRLFQNFLPI